MPVLCWHKAESPQFPVRTLCCSGGRRLSVGEPGPKGPGMLDPGSVWPGRVILSQNNPNKRLGQEVPYHGWGDPPLTDVMSGQG